MSALDVNENVVIIEKIQGWNLINILFDVFCNNIGLGSKLGSKLGSDLNCDWIKYDSVDVFGKTVQCDCIPHCALGERAHLSHLTSGFFEISILFININY